MSSLFVSVTGGRGGLPSSVMMGMLEPVVTEAWRTKPCTGLLSGDDLSIPGGVKPAQQMCTTGQAAGLGSIVRRQL